MRRSALNPFFSIASVRRLQPMIEERLDVFLGRLTEFQESGEPMTISLAYAAFTNGGRAVYYFYRSGFQYLSTFLADSLRCGHAVCVF